MAKDDYVELADRSSPSVKKETDLTGPPELKENAELMPRDGLTEMNFRGYAVSHYNNDLCASIYFIYMTWYLINVVQLPDAEAAGCMLSGQLSDAFSTAIVGMLSDNFTLPWGKRMSWYIMGSILVFPTYTAIFVYPEFVNVPAADNTVPRGEVGFKVQNPSFRYLWYLFFPAIFNVGWASVQISTMSIVNGLTADPQRRDRLINSRNGFTYAANITVLTLTLILFNTDMDDVWKFRYLLFFCLTAGFCTTIFFVTQVDEKKLEKVAEILEDKYQKAVNPHDYEIAHDADHQVPAKWTHWFSEGSFYIHGFVYMFVRISINVSMSLYPFFLNKGLHYEITLENPTPTPLALAPLLQYVVSLVFTLLFQARMTNYLGNRIGPMAVGMVVTICSSVPLLFIANYVELHQDSGIKNLCYIFISAQGVGLAILLNTATSLISDVVGSDVKNAAFVSGFYSFLDRCSNGIILYYVVKYYSGNGPVLSWIIAYCPTLCAIGAFGFTWIGQKFYGHKLAKME